MNSIVVLKCGDMCALSYTLHLSWVLRLLRLGLIQAKETERHPKRVAGYTLEV